MAISREELVAVLRQLIALRQSYSPHAELLWRASSCSGWWQQLLNTLLVLHLRLLRIVEDKNSGAATIVDFQKVVENDTEIVNAIQWLRQNAAKWYVQDTIIRATCSNSNPNQTKNSGLQTVPDGALQFVLSAIISY